MEPSGHYTYKLDKSKNDEFIIIEGKNGMFFNIKVK